jgi:alpha-tubulin suppressor-like RCC1 family protein
MGARTLSLFPLLVALAGCVEQVEVLGPEPEKSAGTIVSDVALGDEHGCAVVNAKLYCWGDNSLGQLGVGGTEPSNRPRALSVDGTWRGVAAGAFHSCAFDELGRVACWGFNDRGQLGTGDRESRDVPSFVELSGRAVALTTDFSHTCVLLDDATLQCWGKNDEGELGQGDPFPGDQSTDADALLPVVVPGTFRAVETGQGHTCAIRLDGALFGWGRNTENELGDIAQIQVRAPIQIGTDTDWLAVEAGQGHTCGLREDFRAHCWGLNNSIENGLGAPLGIAGATQVTAPTPVDTTSDFTLLRTDTFHTCAIDPDARLFCWGRNVEGQLALGDRDLRETPVLVGPDYVGVAVGRFTTCAITRNGHLACAGKNDSGELGLGDTEERELFTPVVFP